LPAVTFFLDDMEDLTCLDRGWLLDNLYRLKADVEKVEDGEVTAEFNPDRPDLFSPEGIARALAGIADRQTGLPQFTLKSSGIEIAVEKSVLPLRPNFACAVVSGLKFNDYSIQSLMNLQEYLHWGLGRNRRVVSIGVHDIQRVKPPFRYFGAGPSTKFVPLDFDREMSMQEILEKHPKGVDYAFILEGLKKYPLIVDAKESVLSFPPIINGELTRVTDDTTDLFIDVTGLPQSVNVALNIVCCALSDRGGTLESVHLTGTRDEVTPDLKPERRTISVSETNRVLGTALTPEDVARHLKGMRHGVAGVKGDEIEVEVAAYRADVMHPWDLAEDVLQSFGYENVVPRIPPSSAVGRLNPSERYRNAVRDVMVGLGFTEVMPFTMTSERVQYEMTGRIPEPGRTALLNPISEDQTMLRTALLPGLMEVLARNRHRVMPQKVFEVGAVVREMCNHTHLAAVSIHAAAGFAEARSLVEAVLAEMGLEVEIEVGGDPLFFKGRSAVLKLGGKTAGVFGEIDPAALTRFELWYPTIGMELDLVL